MAIRYLSGINVDSNTLFVDDANNRVGIGTTSPTSLLHLSSNNSTYETNGILSVSGGVNAVFNSTERFIFNIDSDNTQTDRTFDIAANRTGSSGGTLLFRVQENGNVGIGTTSPTQKLEIAEAAEQGTTPPTIRITNTTTSYGSTATIGVSHGTIEFYQQESSGNYPAVSAAIMSINEDDYAIEHGLGFFTNNNALTPSEQMRITSTGNVGIGTTEPSALLHISSAQNSVIRLTDNDGSVEANSLVGKIEFENLDTESGGVNGYIGGFNEGTTGAVYVAIGTGTAGSASERMRITSAGNVGINDISTGSVATNYSPRLLVGGPIVARSLTANESLISIGGDATSAYISAGKQDGSLTSRVLRFINGTNETMRIDAAGNVGIGTDNPGSLLDVTGPAGVSGSNLFKIQKGGGFGSTDFYQYYNSSSDYGINIGLAVSSAVNGRAGIIIRSTTGGNGTLVFNTTSTERMRITSAGNVGIGTTNPTFKLHTVLTNATLGQVIARFTQDNSLNDPSLSINSTTTGMEIRTSFSTGIAGSFGLVATGGSSFMTLGTAGTEKVRITSGGNVGIGTDNPTQKLHVVGNVRIDDAYTLSWGADTTKIAGNSSANTLSFKTSSADRLYITSGGNVGINTTAPQQLLHVLGATNGYAMIQGASDSGQAGIYFKKEDTTGTMDRTKGLIVFHTNVGSGYGRGHLGFCLNSADSNTVVSVSDEKFRMVDNGDFLADGDVVAYSTTISDARYKTNIQPIKSALDKVNQMRGVSFDWTAVRSGREFGVIAQEIEQIAPEVVSEKELLNGDTMKTVSYTSLVPFLIESIKELTAKVAELESKLNQK